MKIINAIFILILFCAFCSLTMAKTALIISEKKEINQKDDCIAHNKPNGLNDPNMACSVEFTGIGNIQCDGEVIDYSIYFDGQDFGANGYFLIHNGNTTGPFFTLDSIHWGDISYCGNQEMLIIYDADEQTCRDTFFWETPCCPCEFEFTVDQVECDLGQFAVLFELNVTSGSCLPYWGSGVFTVNGVQREFEYIGGSSYLVYPIISNLEYNTYRFTFEQPLGEFHEVTLFNTCRQECTIENFSVTQDTTLCSGEFAGLHFDFESIFFGNNGYTITTNQGLVFEFDQGANRYLEVIADCQDSITFTITDNNEPDCSASFTIPPICCPCQGTYSEIESTSCQNGSFNTVHVFDYVEGSCFAGDWNLKMNGNPISLIWLNDNYLEINNINLPDSIITYELCWEGDLGTCFSLSATNPCFISQYQCHITFEETAAPVCVNDSIVTSLLLYGENISFQGYDVYVNDTFYTWLNYEDDSTYTLVIKNPNTPSYTLRICNNLNQDCCYTRTLENQCAPVLPPCSVNVSPLGNPECEIGEVNLALAIYGDSLSLAGFNLYMDDTLVNFLPFASDSMYAISIIDSQQENFTLTICDAGNPNCCTDHYFTNPCFDTGADCLLSFEKVGEAICDSAYVDFTIFIDGEMHSTSGYRVYLDSLVQLVLPYAEDSLYSVRVPDTGRPFFNITICDEAYPQCCYTREYANPCYEPNIDCNLQFESLTEPVCIGNGVGMTVFIHGENHGFNVYDLYLDGTQFGQISFEADSTYTVAVPDNGQTNYHLTICAGDHLTCCQERVFLNPCYSGIDTCLIFLEEVPGSVCENGLISTSIHVSSQHTSESGYDLFVSDSMVMNLQFSMDSIYPISFPAPGSGEFIITVCDHENAACCRGIIVTNPCVPQGLCRLDQLESQASRSGADSIHLDIEYTVKGVCVPAHKATLWVDLNAPVDYEIVDQKILHTFERVVVDPIVGKLCFTDPFDTCVTMVIMNPFITGHEEIHKDKITAVNLGDRMMVHNPGKKEYQYIFTDLTGRALLRGKSSDAEQIYRLDTNLPSGIYLFTLYDHNQFSTYKLLMTTD